MPEAKKTAKKAPAKKPVAKKAAPKKAPVAEPEFSVLMVDPKGKTMNVTSSKIDEFRAMGYTEA